ncbi:hypothetical protein [Brevibacillus sp. LEMMJ03]|nr:hypothetical protein [Brevibacillus sp. LEMMJ03]
MMKKMISLSVILAMPVWILWGCSAISTTVTHKWKNRKKKGINQHCL